MTQQEQITQLQGQVSELRGLINLILAPGGAFLFKRDTTLGIKDTKIVVGAAASRVAFFGGEPQEQFSTTGESTMLVTSGSTAKNDSGWSGGLGTRYYTVGDIVEMLKKRGDLAQ